MQGFVKYGTEFFLLFLFPFVGLTFHHFLSSKKIVYILVISAVLCTPIFTEYSYIIDSAYVFLGLIILACLFTFFLETFKTNTHKFVASLINSVILFFILGFVAFIKAFSGSITVEKEWSADQYKIKHMRDQGFSGGPLMTYELHQYSFIPLFIKPLETVRDTDTTGSCMVKFESYNILFDKCSGKIIK